MQKLLAVWEQNTCRSSQSQTQLFHNTKTHTLCFCCASCVVMLWTNISDSFSGNFSCSACKLQIRQTFSFYTSKEPFINHVTLKRGGGGPFSVTLCDREGEGTGRCVYMHGRKIISPVLLALGPVFPTPVNRRLN